MSNVYVDLGEVYDIIVGTTKLFESTISDPETSQNLDITDTQVFATSKVLLYRPNGNLICAPITAQYADRPNSIISWVAGAFTNDFAGNHKGVIQMFNNQGQLINQQFFNFNIARVQ